MGIATTHHPLLLGRRGICLPVATEAPDPLAAYPWLWRFEADQIVGLADGAKVATWPDTSGHGRDAVQATDANRPVWDAADPLFDNQPVVVFSAATNQRLVTPAIAADAQPHTMFYVGGIPAVLARTPFDGLGEPNRHTMWASPSEIAFYAGIGVGTGIATPPRNQLWAMVWNGASSRFWESGGTPSTRNIGTQGLTGLVIGNRHANAESVGAAIGAIMVADGILTDAEIDAIGYHLAVKYGRFWSSTRTFTATRTLLTIPTYDGSGQVVHPDVVKIDGGWNGWTYWMAVTPYPSGNDDFENPSILVSNDGTTWQVPPGGSNPVVPFPGGAQYNSDPDLVFDGTTLWLFYRWTEGTTSEKVYVTSSTDGITWAAPTELLSGAFEDLLSPTVVKDGAAWKMWIVDVSVSPNVLTYRTASSPLGPWSAPTTTDLYALDGGDLWHIDIVKDGSTFRAFVNVSNVGTSADGRIATASSTDGISWTPAHTVMKKAASGWDSGQLYRGSAVFEAGAWRFWYSAVTSNVWRVGETIIDPSLFMPAS